MPNPDPARTTTFFRHGFRPFFLFTGIYAVVSMAAWMIWMGRQGGGATSPPLATDFPPFLWHAHEMLFGYTAAALAGAGWCLAFTVFTVVYWPILAGPRADGRE